MSKTDPLLGATGAATLADLIEGRLPDERGRYGAFGGRFVPETLMGAVTRLERLARTTLDEPEFDAELQRELRDWIGRPTALTEARRLGEAWGAAVWLKREDMAHTGAHKINNALGQIVPGQAASVKTPNHRRDRRRSARCRHRRRPGRALRDWSAWSTWARSTSRGRRRTSTG